VAVDGDTIVVGSDCGAAEVFRRRGRRWVHQVSLAPLDPQPFSGFGSSVDIDGDRIIVGAYWNDDGPGSAYMFVRDGTTWVEEQVLTPTDHTGPDSFGKSVSISADDVAVGAPGIGSTYIYTREGPGRWEQRAKLRSFDELLGEFGFAVSIDRDLVAASGWAHRSTDPWALLFGRGEDDWSPVDGFLQAELGIPPPVRIRGNYAAVSSWVYVVRSQRNLEDYAGFQDCFGAIIDLTPTCKAFDLTDDECVDLADFEIFVGTFVGP